MSVKKQAQAGCVPECKKAAGSGAGCSGDGSGSQPGAKLAEHFRLGKAFRLIQVSRENLWWFCVKR